MKKLYRIWNIDWRLNNNMRNLDDSFWGAEKDTMMYIDRSNSIEWVEPTEYAWASEWATSIVFLDNWTKEYWVYSWWSWQLIKTDTESVSKMDVFSTVSWQNIYSLSETPSNPLSIVVILDNHSLNHWTWYIISGADIELTLDYPIDDWEVLQVVYN